MALVSFRKHPGQTLELDLSLPVGMARSAQVRVLPHGNSIRHEPWDASRSRRN